MFRLCRADGKDEEGELGGEWVDRQRHQRGQDHLPGTHSSSRAVRSRTEKIIPIIWDDMLRSIPVNVILVSAAT